jgi:hypothetical protein
MFKIKSVQRLEGPENRRFVENKLTEAHKFIEQRQKMVAEKLWGWREREVARWESVLKERELGEIPARKMEKGGFDDSEPDNCKGAMEGLQELGLFMKSSNAIEKVRQQPRIPPPPELKTALLQEDNSFSKIWTEKINLFEGKRETNESGEYSPSKIKTELVQGESASFDAVGKIDRFLGDGETAKPGENIPSKGKTGLTREDIKTLEAAEKLDLIEQQTAINKPEELLSSKSKTDSEQGENDSLDIRDELDLIEQQREINKSEKLLPLKSKAEPEQGDNGSSGIRDDLDRSKQSSEISKPGDGKDMKPDIKAGGGKGNRMTIRIYETLAEIVSAHVRSRRPIIATGKIRIEWKCVSFLDQ